MVRSCIRSFVRSFSVTWLDLVSTVSIYIIYRTGISLSYWYHISYIISNVFSPPIPCGIPVFFFLKTLNESLSFDASSTSIKYQSRIDNQCYHCIRVLCTSVFTDCIRTYSNVNVLQPVVFILLYTAACKSISYVHAIAWPKYHSSFSLFFCAGFLQMILYTLASWLWYCFYCVGFASISTKSMIRAYSIYTYRTFYFFWSFFIDDAVAFQMINLVGRFCLLYVPLSGIRD